MRFPLTVLQEAVGGGGRYDEMIGKFTGTAYTCNMDFPLDLNVLSCCLWKEDLKFRRAKEKKVYLLDKKLSNEKLLRSNEKSSRRTKSRTDALTLLTQRKTKSSRKNSL